MFARLVKDGLRIGMELQALLPRTYNLRAIADPIGSPCAELMVDKPELSVFALDRKSCL